jgi:4a-hydroxytetrahydrobiopterin dehydratase
MTTTLAEKKCEPCRSNAEPLKGDALHELYAKLQNDWKLINEHHLIKKYTFDDFKQALDFTNRVGALAEEVGHHPTITVTWGAVGIRVYTHKIDGLSEADFVFAAKADERA